MRHRRWVRATAAFGLGTMPVEAGCDADWQNRSAMGCATREMAVRDEQSEAHGSGQIKIDDDHGQGTSWLHGLFTGRAWLHIFSLFFPSSFLFLTLHSVSAVSGEVDGDGADLCGHGYGLGQSSDAAVMDLVAEGLELSGGEVAEKVPMGQGL
ncbi:hypothetical protein M0R45_036066 [Rubus argutus]|uniref:Uncharacterized protein n=1 Tax=Rubus argutus TaxID=59490 RepID=A0AAW1VXJ3_RUBAR